MAREKKCDVGAINVRLQPHSPELYLKLIKRAERLHRPIRIAGDSYAVLSRAMKAEAGSDKLGMISGSIYRFSRIDPNAPWLNVETMMFATEDDKKELVIPPNLRPNSDVFEYLFDPKKHVFFYEAYSGGKKFSAKQATLFVDKLFNLPELVEEFGKVDVTHFPTHDSVDTALGLPQKNFVHMVIKRPNPDDFASTEAKILKRMNAVKAAVMEENLKAIDGESLLLDEAYVTLGRVAASNGILQVIGKNEHGRPEKVSTADHPLQETHYYDHESETKLEVMLKLASDISKRLFGKKRH